MIILLIILLFLVILHFNYIKNEQFIIDPILLYENANLTDFFNYKIDYNYDWIKKIPIDYNYNIDYTNKFSFINDINYNLLFNHKPQLAEKVYSDKLTEYKKKL